MEEIKVQVPEDVPKKRGKGRPKKEEIVSKLPARYVRDKDKSKGGRPIGMTGQIELFKARLLNDVNGNRVIGKILDIAQNDEHPGQMAALKMCMDRLLPLSMFEKDKAAGSAGITINITGLTQPNIQKTDDVVDV